MRRSLDASTLDAPAAGLRASPDGAPRDAAPDAGPGWLVLRDCALGGGGPRVDLALLHPRFGVALVDFAPKDTDAAGRLRRALDARRFPAIFGGHPPVARAVLPADRLPDLGRVLLAEFEALPPLALAGGDAWVGTVRAVVEAEAPPPSRGCPARSGAVPSRGARPSSPSWRAPPLAR